MLQTDSLFNYDPDIPWESPRSFQGVHGVEAIFIIRSHLPFPTLSLTKDQRGTRLHDCDGVTALKADEMCACVLWCFEFFSVLSSNTVLIGITHMNESSLEFSIFKCKHLLRYIRPWVQTSVHQK
jgi:hypothetical protein